MCISAGQIECTQKSFILTILTSIMLILKSCPIRMHRSFPSEAIRYGHDWHQNINPQALGCLKKPQIIFIQQRGKNFYFQFMLNPADCMIEIEDSNH